MKTKVRKPRPRHLSRTLDVSTCAMNSPSRLVPRLDLRHAAHSITVRSDSSFVDLSRLFVVRNVIGSIERLQAQPEGLVETLQR